jgi:hypothetical protein
MPRGSQGQDLLQGMGGVQSDMRNNANVLNSAVNQATSPVTAPTLQLKELDVAAVVSLPVVVDPKSAIRYDLLLVFL